VSPQGGCSGRGELVGAAAVLALERLDQTLPLEADEGFVQCSGSQMYSRRRRRCLWSGRSHVWVLRPGWTESAWPDRRSGRTRAAPRCGSPPGRTCARPWPSTSAYSARRSIGHRNSCGRQQGGNPRLQEPSSRRVAQSPQAGVDHEMGHQHPHIRAEQDTERATDPTRST
jgi:hypothetical protein